MTAKAKTKPFSLLDRQNLGRTIVDAFVKLNPLHLVKNPVMFVVEVGCILTTLLFFQALFGRGEEKTSFTLAITLWLWFTLLFANFAEAMAEGRGKAQARSLKGSRRDVTARLLQEPDRNAVSRTVPGSQLQKGDLVLVEAGDAIPGDGEVAVGIASVDESAITGESAPVIRESGGDRSAVTGGTRVLSDWLVVRITANPGETFLDKMIAMVEGAKRQKTPNEIALDILLAGLTLIFLLATVTLVPFSIYSVQSTGQGSPVTMTAIVALLICLIPTTIGGLLSAIGIAGMDRMIQANVIAMSGKAVEAAGDVDVLLLDKTGTITLGNREATEFLPLKGTTAQQLADAAQLASLVDETPEGRSIVILAKKEYGIRERDIKTLEARFIPFTAVSRMSGVNLDGREIRKGAADAIEAYVQAKGGGFPEEAAEIVRGIAVQGGTPLVVVEAGVDDFLAQATPEAKLNLIRTYQAEGHLVAMTGDGTNDAPALAQADVAVAMNTGTQAAKEAGNLVDLDSNPTKLIEIVGIGKQLLMTRGTLTTFSISNDVAKYFAILPAAFSGIYPGLAILNIMALSTPQSAILSAVIFNALIIVALIPLALRGVRYRPMGAAAVLRRNLIIYGAGGLIVPFAGIKAIDMLLSLLNWK